MKRLVLGIVLWGLTTPAWAANVYEYDSISRRSGGSTFEESNVNVYTDKIEIVGLSGRMELEDIQVYSDDYKADLLTLIEEDSRNKQIQDLRGFFGADAKAGEPTSLMIYLPQNMKVLELVVQIESWSAGARAQVKVSQGMMPYPDPVNPDPIYPPAPTCDPLAITDRILQCSDDVSSLRRDNDSIESSLLALRDRVAERDARVNECTSRRSSLESEIVSLESNLSRTSNEIRRMAGENKRMRRRIHRIENPVQEWDCFVQARTGGRWTERGTNRVQMLQKMVRQCGEVGCGRKWKAKEKGRWGCRPVQGSQNDPKFDEDKEDENDMPGEREGKRGNRGERGDRDRGDRGDREGRRRNG